MSRRVERALLAIILGAFVLLSATYSVVVPPFEASDEKWHYPMVKVIADNGALPVQVPGVETPWRQEGSQAPLYYALGAAATFWIDTSDMALVRHLNPHVDAGATADGNVNLVVHHPAREAFPWRGTVLAVHIVRFLSVCMGAAAVYLTYRIAREILPERPGLALGVTAIHAFTPMVVFISAAVNNDNLAVPLCSLVLLMLVKLAKRESQDTAPREWLAAYLPLGVVLGLAALAKSQALALTVLTALVVTVRAVRQRSWREFVAGGLVTALPLLFIAGWWYLRNLRLYGDLTGLDVFMEILGTRDVPADLAQLWRERYSFLAGYWGNFGGLNVPMAPWVYAVLNGTLAVAGLGLIVALVRSLVAIRRQCPTCCLRFAICNLRFDICDLPLATCHLPFFLSLLWALLVLVPWLWWARETWSSQGRLVFYALPVWSLLLGLGLAAWFPRRWGRWVVAVLALFLLGLSLAAPAVWIAPAYALPSSLSDSQAAGIEQPLAVDFGDTLRLLGYDLEAVSLEPGSEVDVTLYWEALAPADRDYTVFVHVLGEGERLLAQRDTFPGVGLLSTTWLEPGYRWADRYVVRLPETAYAPDTAQIEVGVYDAQTGMRLPVGSGGDNVRFGRLVVSGREGEIPNPIAVNFGDRMALVGYDLDRLIVRPGEQITVQLYWRGLRRMERNYTVSAQLVDAGMRKVAQNDGWPLDGAAPTAAWEVGQVIGDVKTLDVYADAPAGVYDLQIAVYAQDGGVLTHLPVVSSRGEMLVNRVLLTRVRVWP